MTLSPAQSRIPKLIRRSKILIALTLVAMIATITLMTLRFSPFHPVLLVVQTLLPASQVICLKKLTRAAA
jgi:hypothetical protein